MLVKVYGAAVFGVDAHLITVEVDVRTPYGFYLVGLPDNAIKESRERIETAIHHADLEWPRFKITVNLAPADIRKEGSAYDLTIAMGILSASGQVDSHLTGRFLIMGELSLDGTVGPIRGALPIAIMAKELGYRGFILPAANAAEASIVSGLEIVPVNKLIEAVNYFNGKYNPAEIGLQQNQWSPGDSVAEMDFADVCGQEYVKRALEVAAAGGHNVLMIGSPGSGKTMLARRLPTILPPLTLTEALETTKIHSVAGRLEKGGAQVVRRPFRAPHHTISDIALVGGGSTPHPGEISLSHNGVLFLDELPEFRRSVLEVMRQPLEERRVTVSRARCTVDFPASFMLVASMNPCPCGYYTHPGRACICSPDQVRKYISRVSGPLLDRIDLHIEVTPVDHRRLTAHERAEASKAIRARVEQARAIQNQRFSQHPGVYSNAMMSPAMMRQMCPLGVAEQELLRGAIEKLNLSARAYDRILKVSRTIADLAGADKITAEHLAEAIYYRNLDRAGWAG